MQNVSQTELARRLCEAEHPRVPPVRSPGGLPCARHVRMSVDYWPVMNDPGILNVLVRAARDQNGFVPEEAPDAQAV